MAATHMLPLFSESFCPLGRILELRGMLGKETGKWREKERDLTFKSVSLVFQPFDLSGRLPRSLVRTWGIYVVLRDKKSPHFSNKFLLA